MEKRINFIPLKILNILMSSDRPLTTKDICSKLGCERKSVYRAVDVLEINGFSVRIDTGANKRNMYSFNGIYGMDGD